MIDKILIMKLLQVIAIYFVIVALTKCDYLLIKMLKNDHKSIEDAYRKETKSECSVTDFKNGLKMHNEARKGHGKNPLELNDKLKDEAQKYAEKLASKGKELLHDKKSILERGEGENLALLYKNEGCGLNQAIQMWLDEERKPGKNTGGGCDLHFKQMVFVKTTKVGFGLAKSEAGSLYIVARYDHVIEKRRAQMLLL